MWGRGPAGRQRLLLTRFTVWLVPASPDFSSVFCCCGLTPEGRRPSESIASRCDKKIDTSLPELAFFRNTTHQSPAELMTNNWHLSHKELLHSSTSKKNPCNSDQTPSQARISRESEMFLSKHHPWVPCKNIPYSLRSVRHKTRHTFIYQSLFFTLKPKLKWNAFRTIRDPKVVFGRIWSELLFVLLGSKSPK